MTVTDRVFVYFSAVHFQAPVSPGRVEAPVADRPFDHECKYDRQDDRLPMAVRLLDRLAGLLLENHQNGRQGESHLAAGRYDLLGSPVERFVSAFVQSYSLICPTNFFCP